MSDDFLVREAACSDFDQWLSLWEAYNQFYGRSGPTALPEAVTNRTWERFFDPGEPLHALVAEARGTLLGIAHYLFHRSTTSVTFVCYLQDLFTLERARGKGVATALIEQAYDRARVAGASRVYWQTHELNHRARRLYDRIAEYSGFVVYRKSM